MLILTAGIVLVVTNAFALRVQRRYTHSILWRRTIGRLQALYPTLLVWQRHDRLVRAINLLALTLGAVLLLAGLALSS